MKTLLLFIFTFFIFTALYSGGLLCSVIVAWTVFLMITFMCEECNIGATVEQKPTTSEQPAGGASNISATVEQKPDTSEPSAAFRSKPPTVFNNERIRIVMVGKTGVGKSATGNVILGQKHFKSEFSAKSLTEKCEKAHGEVDGQKVAVIDSPGLFDTRNMEEKTIKHIVQSISYASPGPHIFLVVIKLGRFTEEEKQTVQKIQKIFGVEADKYSMVLFTHGDLLKGKTIEEFMKDSKDLQELLSKCKNQYHVFNNEVEDRSQVIKLLEKIRNINVQNGGSCYTNEMFQTAEREIEEEKQRILKEKEEQNRKAQEKLKKEIEEKYQQQLRKMEAEREENKLRAAQAEKEREEEKQRILKEREEQNRKEQEKLKKEMEEKYQQQLRKMEAEREENKLWAAQAEREREEEKLQILKEKEELNRKEQEKLKKEMEEKYQQQLRKMEAEREENKLRAAQAEKEREEERQRIQKEKEEQNRKEQEKLKNAYDREIKEKMKKLREEQDMKARQEAEESCSIITRLRDVCEEAVENFKECFEEAVENFKEGFEDAVETVTDFFF